MAKLQAEWGFLPWFYGCRKWIDDGAGRHHRPVKNHGWAAATINALLRTD